MGRLIGLCVVAVWFTAGLVISVTRSGLFGSGDFSSKMGSLAAVAVIAAIVAYLVKEILELWPKVQQERRRKSL